MIVKMDKEEGGCSIWRKGHGNKWRRDIGGGGDPPLENRQWREAEVEVKKRLW